ncbi:MAG: helix-turn-helix transcriptional regulator [Bacilli bacterium]
MNKSRLFEIVYYLINNKQVTAKELASQFEVSVRTIYRDIDVLSAAGIPIYTESERNGGISLLDGFTLDKIIFSEVEKKEMLSSLQSLAATGNINNQQLLAKISSLFNVKYDSWFEVDFSRFGHTTFDNEKFELIKHAILNNICIDIIYVNSYGIKSKRNINPLKFFYKSKEWYIKSYCSKSKDFRLFKFNRIIEIKLTKEIFIPTTYPRIDYEQTFKYDKIILYFSKTIAYRVYDEFANMQITVQENGDLIVSATMPQDSYLVSYLLSFGDMVEVIEPLHLKEILRKEAYKIYLKNKS